MRDEGLFVSQDPQTGPITIIWGSSLALNKKEFTMAFFNSAVGVLQTLVVALGAGLGIWGAINCFGCGADGDVINFVQQMFNLDAKQAAFKLIDDFHLNIDTKRKESRHEKNQRIRLQKERERKERIRVAYAEELQRFRLKMAEIYRTLHD